MTDPFRAELTVGYLERENLEWAARGRLIRSVRPRPAYAALFRRLASLLARELPVTPRPELQVLPRRQRPAA